MMNRPPASRTSSASDLIASLYFLFSSWKVRLAFKISSLSVSAKPVASTISSSGTCIRRISALAMYSALPPSIISVPRPAMLVAMVTAPFLPAWATISASLSWYLAFSTSCLMPRRFSILLSSSDFSMEMVPTSTGWPFSWHWIISSITASNFPFSVRKMLSGRSLRIMGRLVGISTTSSL